MNAKPDISNLLVQICKQRRNRSNALLAEADVHGGQDILLYHLSMKDGQTISELTEKMCIQYATISNMVNRMEARELIRREKDGTDQRISRLYLTGKGKHAYKHVVKIWKQMESRLSKDLSVKEQDMLKILLTKVLKNLE
jgi:DNA-binding MarR family transcriptional regulator